jgi:peroxiredoxin
MPGDGLVVRLLAAAKQIALETGLCSLYTGFGECGHHASMNLSKGYVTNMKLKVLLIAALLLVSHHGFAAEKVKPLQPGDIAPAFQLNDHRGAGWSWDDVKEKSVVVVAFLGTECPLVQKYAERLQEIANLYEGKNVAVIGVNSNQQDSLAEISHFVKQFSLRFPVLKDAGNVVADQFGAERTPEVFVLDPRRQVHYHGRIDDQYTYGVQKPKNDQPYLVNAIEAILAEKVIAVPRRKLSVAILVEF